ncbi:MAG: glycosyltransferase family 39 protein [Flavobacteriales bacterium]|nr:glycosyltransferase family 39 protein [Flavobacteriales bacterium]
MRRGSTDVFVVVALLLLCGVVRALFIGLNELAHDEPFTLYWAHRPLGELFAQLRTENNPPLHFLLVKVWLPIAGWDVTLLRMPSALFSALTVWPLFLLGRELGGRLVGFTAALLFTCSSYHQGFAHEVRAYTLFALLAAVGMWQLARTARKGIAALGLARRREHRDGLYALLRLDHAGRSGPVRAPDQGPAHRPARMAAGDGCHLARLCALCRGLRTTARHQRFGRHLAYGARA